MSDKICFKCRLPLMKENREHYGLHYACFMDWFGLNGPKEFMGITRRGSESSSQLIKKEDRWNTSFFQGQFRKYSATLCEQDYILKLGEKEAPELPFVEYTCNEIARCLDITVPDFFLIKFNGEVTFVNRNFIDSSKVMSLNHIYHYLSSSDEYNCELLLQIIMEQIPNNQSIEQFIEMCLYDSLIGNHDRHGRNFGFIITKHGSYFSPVYDNTSALGLEYGDMLKADFSPKGKIYTSTSKEPTTKDYIKEFVRLGHEGVVENFRSKVDYEAIKNIIDKGLYSNLMKQALRRLFKCRFQELEDALP